MTEGVVTVAPKSVAEMLLQHRGSDRPAFVFEERTWTWDEYIETCLRYASWISRTLRPGIPKHIGVLADNCPEFLFVLGGAALSGSTVVCLNATRSIPEIAHDLTHTDCAIVVGDEKYVRGLAGSVCVPTYVLGPDLDKGVSEGAAPLPDTTDTASVLYTLVFTSGTTGAPKAVRSTQGRLAARALGVVERAGLTSRDVHYVTMPLFHSNSLLLGWLPSVAVGSCVVLRRRFSASGFVPDILRYKVTYANYIGTALAYVLDSPVEPGESASALRVLYGNEASDRVIVGIKARFGCAVIDGYGTSEGAIGFTRTPDTPPGSIGRARGEVRVLNSDGTECPPATFDAAGRLLDPRAVGELVSLGGAAQFEGYYANPDAMAERVRNGDYWSGDLGYRDANGFFYHAGRAGTWLRVDGENLSVAEIERWVNRYPDFVEAAVYAVPNAIAGDSIMCAAVVRTDSVFDGAAFESWARSRADYSQKWLPTYIRIAESIPHTATNKSKISDLAKEQWFTVDTVWWRTERNGRYQILDGEGRAKIESVFRQNGRESLLAGRNAEVHIK